MLVLQDVGCLRDLPYLYEVTTADDVYNAYNYLSLHHLSLFTCMGVAGSEAGKGAAVVEVTEELAGMESFSLYTHTLRSSQCNRHNLILLVFLLSCGSPWPEISSSSPCSVIFLDDAIVTLSCEEIYCWQTSSVTRLFSMDLVKPVSTITFIFTTSMWSVWFVFVWGFLLHPQRQNSRGLTKKPVLLQEMSLQEAPYP